MVKLWLEAHGVAQEFDSTADVPGEHDGNRLSDQTIITIPACQDSSRILEPGAQSKDEENQPGLEMKNITSETYEKKVLERHVPWANGKILVHEVHRLIFQSGTDVFSWTTDYLQAAIQNLSDSKAPLVVVSTP